MGEIATSNRQITLFYDPNTQRGKETLAYATAEGLAIQAIDLTKTELTGTQIKELASKLCMKVSELVNQDHPNYSNNFEHHELSTEDWIKMIQHNPTIMKQPIAMHGEKTKLIETPTQIISI